MILRLILSAVCLLLLAVHPLQAQQMHDCGTMHLHNAKLNSDPQYAQRLQQLEQAIYQKMQQQQGNMAQRGVLACDEVVYTIPTVFHIIHNNGAENIPNSDIYAFMESMNEGLRNIGYYDKGNGVDVKFELCLAVRAPGDVATNGINRVVSAAYTDLEYTTEDGGLKDLSRWETEDYLNIWVVSEICSLTSCGVAGYAYFAAAHGQSYDGIVIEAGYVNGTDPNAALNLHELGHYLNLYHTFEGGCTNNDCLTDGDRVCDTPPDNSTSGVWPCSGTANSCSTDADDPSANNPFSADVNDYLQNYMDYGFQVCQDQFTQGQKDRMREAFLFYRSSLLDSKGCIPVNGKDVALERIVVPSGNACAGTFQPVVNVTNNGGSALTSLTASVSIDGGSAIVTNWTGSIAANTSANITLNSVTVTATTHLIEVNIATPNGVTDTITFNNSLCSSFSYAVPVDTFCVDFGASSFPPTNWLADDITDPYGWGDTTVGCHGTVAFVNSFGKFNNINGNYETLQLANVDLSRYSAASLAFDMAYKRTFSNRTTYLYVLVSDDCGLTFDTLFNQTEAALASVTGFETTTWAPTSCSDWDAESVNLNSYVGQVVTIQFVVYMPQYYGQNLYLDNVCLNGTVIPPCTATFDLGPDVETCEGVSDTLDAGAGYDSYLWSPGGSTSQTIPVSGLLPGTYTYKVTVTACTAFNPTTLVDSFNVIVGDTVLTTINQTICQGDTYLGYSTTGIYMNDYPRANGCDSTRVLNLTVLDTFYTVIDTTVCYGETVLGFDSTDTYIDYFSAGNSCDSTRVLNLTVLPQNTTYISQTICQGDTYLGYSSSGIYPDVYTAANGCDSTRTLTLTVLPILAQTVDTTICFGQTVLGYANTGAYRDTFSTASCDSIRTLNLTVLPASGSIQNITICQGESYGGHNSGGFYTDTYTDRNGCDSIRVLFLTVRPTFGTTVDSTICYGSTLLGYGATGIYRDTFAAANTCDSIRILNLTVLPQNTTNFAISICQGDSYAGYTSGGTYTDTYTDANGCDSTRTVVLSITAYLTQIIDTTVCYGVTVLGYTSTGTYLDTFSTASCDSIRTLNLTVLPQNSTTLNETICQGETLEGYFMAGTYRDTFASANTCDSIRILNLTVNDTAYTVIDSTICFGETLMGYNATGTYRDTFVRVNTCDSIRVLSLTVLPHNTTNFGISICQGDSYAGYSSSGTYTDTFTDVNGCDSTRIVVLTVVNNILSTVDTTVCYGQTALGYASSGIYMDTFATASCDSIRTLNLTVLGQNSTTLNETICQGETFEGYFNTGTYRDTFAAANTCDSIRILNLTVNDTAYTQIDTTVCFGETVLGYAASGTYRDTFSTANSCDSFRVLSLTVLPQNTTNLSVSICQGDSYAGYTSDGTYTDTFTAASGCDSTRTVVLTVLTAGVTTTMDTTVCAGNTVEGYGATGIFADTFATGGCDSIRILDLTVLPASQSSIVASICLGDSYDGYMFSGTFTDALSDASGCDSIRTLQLTVLPPSVDSFFFSICLGDSISFGGVTIGQGVYSDTMQAANACDSIAVAVVTAGAVSGVVPELYLSGDTLFTDGGFVRYQWFLNNNPIPGADSSFLFIQESGNYFVVAIDGNGCILGTDTLYAEYTAVPETDVWAGVAVYPNPAENEVIIDLGGMNLPDSYDIAIYNVVGQQVIHVQDVRSSKYVLPVVGLSDGLYLMHLISDKQHKLVKLAIDK